jgi:Rrf2 family protein
MRLELTRRADYAVRASLALARAGTERLSVRRLATEQRIPLAFLPRIMSDLVRAGVVEATTGRAGGYRLTRPASEISILDVVQAVEGDVRRRTCVLRGGSCGLDGVCAVHPVFEQAQDDLLDRLAAASLGDLCARRAS